MIVSKDFHFDSLIMLIQLLILIKALFKIIIQNNKIKVSLVDNQKNTIIILLIAQILNSLII